MKAVFTGAFLALSAEDREWIEDLFGGFFETVKLNHVTLAFKPSPEELDATPLGKEIDLRVIGKVEARDFLSPAGETTEGVQALVVELPAGIGCGNSVPHVTVSVKGSTKPVSSNWALEAGWDPITPFTLHARVGCFANTGGKTRVVFQHPI